MTDKPQSPSALILLAPGCEEMEAVIVMDVLRRGGMTVVAAGVAGAGVFKASRNVKLAPDIALDELQNPLDFDLVILPGGLPGTRILREDARIRDILLHYAEQEGKRVASICAAALVLDAHGLLEGRKFTCYPAVAEHLSGGTRLEERVVVDGDLITSQGPGTAMEFALKLVEIFKGRETREEVARGMLYRE